MERWNDGTMSPCGATHSSGVQTGAILPPSNTTSPLDSTALAVITRAEYSPLSRSSFEKLNNNDSSQKPGVFAILIRCTNEQITFPDLDTILPMRAEDMTREAGFQQPGRRDRYDDLSTPLPMVISNHWCH
ncbi:hypothetical protein G5I_13429 [Acromyrmex echinatior]|uniref:Uncharacterized protein n=1 Tax=Acromyrmex echinatior TaxID=103372 RepID=F4X506_ACREC|nr:hypothetical protein G5I_13429 [Acromyrmex echinatior]